MINIRKTFVGMTCGIAGPAFALAGAPGAGAYPDDPTWIERSYTTEVSWTPPSCIGVEVAEREGGTTFEEQCNFGDPNPKTFSQVAAPGGAHLGANPLGFWGTSVSCKVIEDATGRVIAEDSGVESAHKDVNCLTVDG